MRIDPEDLRRHYRSIPDEELTALDPEELTEMAQGLYVEELSRRGLTARREAAGLAEQDDEVTLFAMPDEEEDAGGEFDVDTGPPPDWLDNAGCAWAFEANATAPDLAQAVRTTLRVAGIPCYITLNRVPSVQTAPRQEYRLMVPNALGLQAVSVLDRDIFNEKQEEGWRAQFEALTDEELRAQKPEILCAGLLDLVERLKRAYQEEVARRKLRVR